MTEITIRAAAKDDDAAIWAMLEPVFRAGETYGVDVDISAEDALAWWTGSGRRVFIAELAGKPVGTYYITRSQGGGGAHVCNCGFVTAPEAEGKGVGRSMLAHALDTAREAGFVAMQFNFVIASNVRAVALWQQHGFDIVGCVPGAFRHPGKGAVDVYIMHRKL